MGYMMAVLSEILLIFTIFIILKVKNQILFYLYNLTSSLILFLGLVSGRYFIFILSLTIKLGLFPFTYMIIVFYPSLSYIQFIIMNIIKLPYIIIYVGKVNLMLLIITFLYILCFFITDSDTHTFWCDIYFSYTIYRLKYSNS